MLIAQILNFPACGESQDIGFETFGDFEDEVLSAGLERIQSSKGKFSEDYLWWDNVLVSYIMDRDAIDASDLFP